MDNTEMHFDQLLCLPSVDELEMTESQSFTKDPLASRFIPRATIHSYENKSERFQIEKRTFESQYADIYSKRLKQMKPWIIETAAKKLKGKENLPILEKLLHIKDGQHCIIVGTLFKQMPLVTRVLDEFAKERSIGPIPPRSNFTSAEDGLILEDETGRTTLVGEGKHFINIVVTGVVAAVKGTSLKGGEFRVEEIILPGLAPQAPLKSFNESKYVAFISGTRIGDQNQNPLSLQLFVDFVTGNGGSVDEQKFASQIVKVIIAGDTLCAPENSAEGQVIKQQISRVTGKQQRGLVAPLKELDAILTQLSTSVTVDLMPGENDPANYTLPQQSFNRCLFPMSNQFESFQSVTNPYECKIEGRIILGTSGQTLNNIDKYLVIDDKLDLCEQTLQWRHIAPTAPDQLACYPFNNLDPFVLEYSPHVYFIGNQKEFKSKLVKGENGQIIRIIMVPTFAETPIAVLLNLSDLSVQPVSFNTVLHT